MLRRLLCLIAGHRKPTLIRECATGRKRTMVPLCSCCQRVFGRHWYEPRAPTAPGGEGGWGMQAPDGCFRGGVVCLDGPPINGPPLAEVDVGPRMKERRRSLGLTLREAARRARVAASYLSDLENGRKSDPGLRAAQRIARTLGVGVEDLFGPGND